MCFPQEAKDAVASYTEHSTNGAWGWVGSLTRKTSARMPALSMGDGPRLIASATTPDVAKVAAVFG